MPGFNILCLPLTNGVKVRGNLPSWLHKHLTTNSHYYYYSVFSLLLDYIHQVTSKSLQLDSFILFSIIQRILHIIVRFTLHTYKHILLLPSLKNLQWSFLVTTSNLISSACFHYPLLTAVLLVKTDCWNPYSFQFCKSGAEPQNLPCYKFPGMLMLQVEELHFGKYCLKHDPLLLPESYFSLLPNQYTCL